MTTPLFLRRALTTRFIVALLVMVTTLTTLGQAMAPTAGAATTCGSSTLSVTPLYNPTFYTAFAATPVSNSVFVGYKIQNHSNTATDYWAQIGNFTGGLVNLAATETPNHDVGTLKALTGVGYAYFFVTASGLSNSTTGAQNHSLTLYSGNPSSGATTVCVFNTDAGVAGQGGFSSVVPTITALANKVTSDVGPTAAGPVGSNFTLVATGQTGTIGAGPSASYDVNLNPITNSAWPAASYQLSGVSLTYANSGTTISNLLWLQNQAAYAGNYTATFTFTIVSEPTTAGVVSPIEEIASGTQMKHNQTPSTPFTPVLLYQTISFPAFNPVASTVGTVTLSGSTMATASSGLPVTYGSSSSSSICTVSGTTVTVVGAGDCAVTATQAGTSTYEPVSLTQVLPITGSGQLTVLYNSNSATSGTAPVPGLYASGATVTVSTNSGALARTGYTFLGWNTQANNSGTEYAPGSGTFTLTSSVTLYATWSANQTITFGVLAPETVGSGTLTLTASASSGLAINYSTTSGPSICTISGNVVTIKGASGQANYCIITAAQAGSSVYPYVDAAVSVTQSMVLLPASTYNVTYDPNGATSGTVPQDTNAYTSGATATVIGNTGSLVQTGDSFYGWNTQPDGSGTEYVAGSTFSVTGFTTLYAMWALTQTIIFPAPSAATYTTGSFTASLAAAASSGLVVTFAVSSGPCTVSGVTLTVTGAGSCAITATQAGSTVYPFVSPASPVSQTLTVTALTSATLTYDSNSTLYPAVTGSVPASQTYSSGVFSATVAGNTGPLALSGYSFYDWNTQPDGSGNAYFPAATFTVQANTTLYAQWLQSQSITFTLASPVAQNVGPITLNGTASSGLPVYYTVSGPCTVSVAVLTVTGGGTCTVIAHQDGDAATSAATSVTQALTITATDTITFNSEGGSAVSSVTGSNGTTITLPAAPTYSGYTFLGWFAASSGGTALTSPYTLATSTTLYAQWSANTNAVTFSTNLGSGAMSNESFTSGLAQAITTNTFTRNGYTFSGWNTLANGAGTAYSDAQSVIFNTPTTLYAQWSAVATDTITFNSEGGSAVSSVTGSNGTTITLPAAPTYSGYTFLGWFAASSGGTALTSPYTLATSTTLYAQWSANTNAVPSSTTVTVTFNSEGGSAVSSDTGSIGTTITLPAAPTYMGYSFEGWFTSPNGGSALPSPYSLAASTTLYAQWSAVIQVDQATYSANGGTGSAKASGNDGATITLASGTGFTRPGYTFEGWSVTGSGPALPSRYTLSGDVTLEAIWLPDPVTTPVMTTLRPITVTHANPGENQTPTFQLPVSNTGPVTSTVLSVSVGSGEICAVNGTGLVSFTGRVGSCVILSTPETSAGRPGTSVVVHAFKVAPVVVSGSLTSVVGSLRPVANQIVSIAQPIRLSMPAGSSVTRVTVNGRVVDAKINSSGQLILPFLVGPRDKVGVLVEINGHEVLVPIAAENRPIALGNVNFNFDSSSLTPKAKSILRRVAQVVLQHGFTKIDLIGYTDVLASPGFSNQRLSNERALSARAYLAGLLGSRRVKTVVGGRAARDPLETGRSARARALNRRVEIIVG